MPIQEFAQHGGDDEPADAAGHVDAQPAGGAGGAMPEQRLGFFDVGDHPQATFIEDDAVGRRRYAARASMQQPGADAPFQFLHGRRH